jgi:hypothetical protein
MANVPVPTLPDTFCVRSVYNGRDGYVFYHSSAQPGQNAARIRPAWHQNMFYNIVASQETEWRNYGFLKSTGTVVRIAQWQKANQYLSHGGVRYDVIKVSPRNVLPAFKTRNFIPIVNNNPPAQAPAPAPAQPAPANKNIPITKIPQHAIRALLRDAVMHEEKCPITDEDIDVSNGAVTSCFHLFQRDAIQQWLLMPNSQQKCPVCNAACNAYTLDGDGPPPLVEADNDVIEIIGEA